MRTPPGEDITMHEHDDGLRRLDADDDWITDRAARQRSIGRRDAGVRRTRQISGWTAAALVAGVAAGAGYFAHAAGMPTVSTTSGTAGQSVVNGTGQKPSLTHPVVTSGGSGVTAGQGGAPGSGGVTAPWRDN
jgi:hypothetical protein